MEDIMRDDENKTLIHIGFPKTGSTFLQTYFEENPSIYHNRERFKKYIETGVIDESLWHKSSEKFPFDILSEELLSIWQGNVSQTALSTYNFNFDVKLKQKEVAEKLSIFFPQAKILIVTRNYRTLVSALYSQYLFSGGVSSLRYLLRTKQYQNLRLFNYDYIIQTYQDIFGKENVILLPFEFLQENPKEYLLYIEKVFGIPHHDFQFEKIHGSLNTVTAFLVRWMNRWIHFRLLFISDKTKKRERFLNYIAWLYGFKEKLNAKIKLGKKIIIPEEKLKLDEFRKQSKLVRFEGDLSKYNKYYE